MPHELKVRFTTGRPETLEILSGFASKFRTPRHNRILENFKKQTGIDKSGEYTCTASSLIIDNNTKWELYKKPEPKKKKNSVEKFLENIVKQPICSSPEQTKISDQAKSPYNFISQPPFAITIDEEPIGHEIWQEPHRHSGTIRCELENLTPFYTRDGRGQKNTEGETLPDFFHLDNDTNNVVIPPRSLKGMTRSAMEILSFAPLRPEKDYDINRYAWRDIRSKDYMDQLMNSRREGDTTHIRFKVKAGIIAQKENELVIHPCSWALVLHDKLDVFPDWRDFLDQPPRQQDNESKENLFPIRPVKFTLGANTVSYLANYRYDRRRRREVQRHPDLKLHCPEINNIFPAGSSHAPNNAKDGWLFAAGHMPRKKAAFVFYDDKQNMDIPITSEMREQYREFRTEFMRELLPNDGELNAGEPVFYIEKNGELEWFGRALMFRILYHHDTKYYALHQEQDKYTIPDSILGFVKQKISSETKEQNYCGRVSFSHGTLKTPDSPSFVTEYNQVIKPNILSSPKPTTFQHYLVQQEQHTGRSYLRANYNSSVVETVLRGRKRYWHRKFDDIAQYGEIEQRGLLQGTQHTHIRPLEEGHLFTFQVRFDNLSEEELGLLTLSLALDFNQDEQANYAHKLGMGKPLGFGSVKVRITGVDQIQRKQRYQQSIGKTECYQKLEGNKLAEHIEEWQDKFRRFLLEKSSDVLADVSANVIKKIDKRQAVLIYEKGFKTIAEFMRMCNFDNAPSIDNTKYMQIEPDDGSDNEFKYRNILPSPLDVE